MRLTENQTELMSRLKAFERQYGRLLNVWSKRDEYTARTLEKKGLIEIIRLTDDNYVSKSTQIKSKEVE